MSMCTVSSLRTVLFIYPVRDGDATNHKLYFHDTFGERQMLPAPSRNIFGNKAITCIEYEDLTAEQEREIFRVGHIAPHGVRNISAADFCCLIIACTFVTVHIIAMLGRAGRSQEDHYFFQFVIKSHCKQDNNLLFDHEFYMVFFERSNPQWDV